MADPESDIPVDGEEVEGVWNETRGAIRVGEAEGCSLLGDRDCCNADNTVVGELGWESDVELGLAGNAPVGFEDDGGDTGSVDDEEEEL